MSFKSIKTKLLVGIALLSFGILAGCGDDTTTNSVTNPNPNTLLPTGTIQGRLVDSCTQQPIVGAVIDIGLAQATTSATGQFVMQNVPVTDASGVSGQYEATIDMRNVSSPVNMPANPSVKYANFAYESFKVEFSTLDETSNNDGGSGSNHDTPVVGLVGGASLDVGKLSTSISGVVARGNLQPVGAGFTVKLVSNGSNISGAPGTGGVEHVVGITTTDDSGKFSFSNVEAKEFLEIRATDTNTAAPALAGSINVVTPCDGETLFLGIQQGSAVIVNPTDGLAPIIIATSPENNSDISATGGVNVTFTFSEPIRQTAKITGQGLTASDTTGLFALTQVNFIGNKAGNIAHSLSWNGDAMTVLTVNIPELGPSSRYTVDITGAAALLSDATGKAVANIATNGVVNFTTFGAAAVAAPVVTINNLSTINFDSTALLDWPPVAGAKLYNVYCRKNQVFTADNTTSHPFVRVGTDIAATSFDFTPGLLGEAGFVENNHIKLTFDCFVKGVGADKTEGAASNIVNAADVVAPNVTASDLQAQLAAGVPFTTIQVLFNEPMDEALVETAANYTINAAAFVPTVAPPTVTSAVYNVTTKIVILTLSAAIDPATVNQAQILTGPNGVNNTPISGLDTTLIPTGNGGDPNFTCVNAGPDNVFDAGTVNTGDDVLDGTGLTVIAGPNGVCNTTAAGNDVQLHAAGTGSPNLVAIAAGTNFTLQSTPLVDDTVTRFDLLTVGSGVKDVAGNSIDPLFNDFTTDGLFR